jgi:hypothetical protein
VLLQVAAGERSASLVCFCLGMLAFVALSGILAPLYTLSYASSGVAWGAPLLALFQRGGSAGGGGALWRRNGAAGVSICTFVLVDQVNWEPPLLAPLLRLSVMALQAAGCTGSLILRL